MHESKADNSAMPLVKLIVIFICKRRYSDCHSAILSSIFIVFIKNKPGMGRGAYMGPQLQCSALGVGPSRNVD